MKLTKDDELFLTKIRDGERPGVADRAADKVRQRCRRLGLCEFHKNKWNITDAGRKALEDQE